MKDSRLVRLVCAAYRALLVLYPRGHRREFGRDMDQFFRDLGPGALFRDSDAGTPVGGGTEARLRAGTAPLLSESDGTAPFRAVATRTL